MRHEPFEGFWMKRFHKTCDVAFDRTSNFLVNITALITNGAERPVICRDRWSQQVAIMRVADYLKARAIPKASKDHQAGINEHD